jgi:hypothetical protein
VSERRWLEGDDDPAAIELRRALDEARLGTPDDVTLRRMWGRVAEPRPLRPRAPRWLWFASGVASTAAAAVAIAGWMAHHHRTPAVAPPPAMAASHAPASPSSAPAVPERGPAVIAPGTVRNGGQETLVLTLRGGVEARLGSASVMSLDASERPTVEGGDVGFQVPHQKPGHTFAVRAGKYRVVVIGTRFHLRVDERQRVFVSVEEGTVEVWDRTRLAELAPGDSWASAASDSGEAEAAQRVPATRAARREPRTHTVALSTPSAPTREATSAGASDGAPAAAPATAPTATAAAGVSPALPTGELAAQARAAAAAGDGPRALALYRALALRDGPAGENAEYEIGKLLRDRMGQPMAAIAAWRHYRSEHPNGLLRVEADVSIVEALVHAGEPDAALAEANEFLHRFPSSERRAEIARVAGDLLRARGDCARAVAAYETALSAPRAASVAEAATFHRASCLVQLGDASGADAARAYLRAWPNGRFRDQAAQLAAVGRSDGEGRSRP